MKTDLVLRVMTAWILCQFNCRSESHGFGYGQKNELGLICLKARHLDPEVGIFISKDPQGIYADANVYRYCYQNPVNMVDLSGEHPAPVPGVAAFASHLQTNFDALHNHII